MKRFRFWINVDPITGTSIRDVAADAVEFANRFGCGVTFNFNGVLLFAHAGGDPDAIVATYDRSFGRSTVQPV